MVLDGTHAIQAFPITTGTVKVDSGEISAIGKKIIHLLEDGTITITFKDGKTISFDESAGFDFAISPFVVKVESTGSYLIS